ncbi:hypothetical protein ABVK25_006447 [Lepraria finkii]|uniref:peptidylprolyl isomerase n=1 Tax=Lepraria finkii TaxID=1340010 RepID=A0ABR4BB93_9LECA
MGVTRKVIKEGTSSEMPKKGDEVTVEYTGYLYDSNVGQEKDFRGKQFDSSIGRGDFQTRIGMGKVIKGVLNQYAPEDMSIAWDEGVLKTFLGEKSILTISGYAYTF